MYSIDNFQMEMKELNRERTIRVYLPSDYKEDKEKKYSVLYMHDGHNLFYKETSAYGMIWNAHKALMENEKKNHKDIILVGIDCNMGEDRERLNEYSPWINNKIEEIAPSFGLKKLGGEGEAYMKFIVNSLKPYIDNEYRTLSDRENTYMAGSSMGAFISLYAGFKYPEIFSVIGAFSTAVWFQQEELEKFLRNNFNKSMKIYLDIGTKETSDVTVKEFNSRYLNGTKDIYNLLLELGQPKENIKLYIDEGANHSEASWEKRFPIFLDWMNNRGE